MTVKYVFNPTTGKIDATDKVAFNGEVNLGTAAAPSIFFTGDPNTGIYSPGADQVAISTGGTGRLFVDSSGRVGVGTSGPNVLLHLDSAPAGTGSAGVIGFGDASNYRFAEIEGYREGGSFAGSLIFRTQTSGGISAAGSERLRITSDGLVGIGTASPANALQVVGAIRSSGDSYLPIGGTNWATTAALITNGSYGGGISIVDGSKGFSAYTDTLGTRLNLAYGNVGGALTNGIVFTNSGRLGVGTTSPSYTLDVAGSTSAARIGKLNILDDAPFVTGANLAASSNFAIGTQTASSTLFYTNNTERARIDSSGQLSIGTSGANTAYFDGRLRVLSSGGAASFSTTGAAGALPLAVWHQATSGDNLFVSFGTETTHAQRGTITYNRTGGVVAYNTTSDYRAKTILGDIQNPGDTIDALKVYRGVMNGATVERPMLIAHEAQEVAPYCVTGEKDAVDAEGNPIYQQMDHQVLVPLLIAEIQQLRARVAALESA